MRELISLKEDIKSKIKHYPEAASNCFILLTSHCNAPLLLVEILKIKKKLIIENNDLLSAYLHLQVQIVHLQLGKENINEVLPGVRESLTYGIPFQRQEWKELGDFFCEQIYCCSSETFSGTSSYSEVGLQSEWISRQLMFKEIITTQIIFLSSSFKILVSLQSIIWLKNRHTASVYSFLGLFFYVFKIRIAVFEQRPYVKDAGSQVQPSL